MQLFYPSVSAAEFQNFFAVFFCFFVGGFFFKLFDEEIFSFEENLQALKAFSEKRKIVFLEVVFFSQGFEPSF